MVKPTNTNEDYRQWNDNQEIERLELESRMSDIGDMIEGTQQNNRRLERDYLAERVKTLESIIATRDAIIEALKKELIAMTANRDHFREMWEECCERC